MAAAAFSERPPAFVVAGMVGAEVPAPAGAAASEAPQKLQKVPEASWWHDGHSMGFLLLQIGSFRGEQEMWLGMPNSIRPEGAVVGEFWRISEVLKSCPQPAPGWRILHL